MADVAISQLTYGLPSLTASIPFSESGTTLRVAPSGLLVSAGLILDKNNGNVLNDGLILSGGPVTIGNSPSSSDIKTGIQSFNIARHLVATDYESYYVHIVTPFNRSASDMFFLEVKGYALHGSPTSTGTLINVIFTGYQSTVANSDLQRVSTWDAMNAFSPTVYYSTNRNRTVCSLYFPVGYYANFVVNSIAMHPGRILKPGDLQIINSPNSII